MTEPTQEVMKGIINKQIQDWIATRYSMQLQHRVQVGLGNQNGIAEIEKLLLDCEKALDILQGELDKICGER